ncbi:MAG: oligosaccharide flippase family protein, partial [Paludibacteraceae bacterium]|nr:oligosaccharide flippase family protein [Paludibacteraceae bacterium]
MALIENIKSIYSSLKSRNILQNYTWMTILNIVSPLIGVILYPFVIRKTGSDSYGLFVFAQSVIQYAVQLVSFGFDVPAAKTIAQNKTDKALQSKLVTHVLAMKTMLSLIAVAAFLPFVFTLSILSDNKPIFLWSITLIIAELFNLQFFFQGIGKMKVMSIMSLVFRILMIPAVF